MHRDRLIIYGNRAMAVVAILTVLGMIGTGLVYLELNPVSAKELKAVQRENLAITIPLLKQQTLDYRITRGQLKALPQTSKTIEDIEAYNERIQDYQELLAAAKARAKELK